MLRCYCVVMLLVYCIMVISQHSRLYIDYQYIKNYKTINRNKITINYILYDTDITYNISNSGYHMNYSIKCNAIPHIAL